MLEPLNLTEAARELLRRNLAGEHVKVTDDTRTLYQELAGAGLMEPLHTFALGPNSAYRLTDAACDLRDRISDSASPFPSTSVDPSRQG